MGDVHLRCQGKPISEPVKSTRMTLGPKDRKLRIKTQARETEENGKKITSNGYPLKGTVVVTSSLATSES